MRENKEQQQNKTKQENESGNAFWPLTLFRTEYKKGKK